MKAKDWANELWKKSEKDWINRMQDNNYREYLVRPALEDELSDIYIDGGIAVDIGCGEGKETYFMKEMLKRKGFRTFYGFDTNEKFIDSANNLFEEITFDVGDFSKLKIKHHLEGPVDLITSLFVLQDTPSVKNLVNNCYNSLKDKGRFLTCIVHPQYAKILLEKGAIKINEKLKKVSGESYTFAGAYPITEPEKPPFYVPYFHRDLSEYIKIFEKYFHIESVRGLKPSDKLLKKSKEEKISPLYEDRHNVYWKEISEVSSSLIIKGIKK